jgi:lysozyme
MAMQTSDQMRHLIEGFEGCRLEPYADAVGVWTVGFGHTGHDVYQGCDPITQQQADQLLAADLQRFEHAVAGMAPTTSQQQFDALVSFSYNLGEGALRGSTLLRLHNEGNYTGAAGEFSKWNHAGGQVLAGLTRRRAAEAACYANGVYGSDASSSTAAGTTSTQPILRRGSSGDAVSALQTKLGITADGQFGTHTDATVKQFQTNNGLAPDGVVGPQTWAKLA